VLPLEFVDSESVNKLETIMENHPTGTVTAARPTRHWPLFLLGVLLFVAGPAIYAVEFQMKHLKTPWYAPIMATAGVLLMAVSVIQRRGILRIVGLVLFALLCGLEWLTLLVGMATPSYSGPAQAGKKVPAFATALADGKAFTDKDLEDGKHTVLLFFRGRW
jgi:hypothetical protein